MLISSYSNPAKKERERIAPFVFSSRCRDHFFLPFGFLTSFFAPCREAAMFHHLFRLLVSISRNTIDQAYFVAIHHCLRPRPSGQQRNPACP
jgi:hypothetical protein